MSQNNATDWQPAQPGEGRSPCPALNSLANGGHLPRNGIASRSQLITAIVGQLGISTEFANTLANAALEKFGKPGDGGEQVLHLQDLCQHGKLEHDASLTRQDAHAGDHAKVDPSLVEQLLSLSKNGQTLTLDDLAAAHQIRMHQSAQGGHHVPGKAGFVGTVEAALLYTVLARGESGISLADAREFLLTERVPQGLAGRNITLAQVAVRAIAIAAKGNLPVCEAARRAKEATKK
ncbi:MAG TPA: hypothetical protein PKI49_04950 [Pseudomonadota bacterium]|mgnify:CR=1 FL=1|jgi:hypothetical protein|nr:hypothetical protein [Pseudomonadota bacterium]HNF97321.1 hypothetical protein [Pseudomonadota bacterium]HNI58764.1 hypothetical protein [Pseudomonadota bacterium]HNK45120.1 hypothetical protein [Pseudomonadota bacterium]HNN51854.1 hypothetical protein [Pseudomonadota bacterium]